MQSAPYPASASLSLVGSHPDELPAMSPGVLEALEKRVQNQSRKQIEREALRVMSLASWGFPQFHRNRDDETDGGPAPG